jgi:hypothetical protein
MKTTLAKRVARLEALSPDDTLIALTDEELSRGLALIRATIDCKQSGHEATDEGLAETLGWSLEDVQTTSAQFLAIADEMKRQGRL